MKVVFKPKKAKKKVENGSEESKTEDTNTSHEGTNFSNILGQIINDQKNPYLTQTYELVVNGKEMEIDDILFL